MWLKRIDFAYFLYTERLSCPNTKTTITILSHNHNLISVSAIANHDSIVVNKPSVSPETE